MNTLSLADSLMSPADSDVTLDGFARDIEDWSYMPQKCNNDLKPLVYNAQLMKSVLGDYFGI